MADDRLAVAVDEVAKRVVSTIIGRSLTFDDEEWWSRFPEIGEDDWRQVVDRVNELGKSINPENGTFDAAYEFLAGRAEQ